MNPKLEVSTNTEFGINTGFLEEVNVRNLKLIFRETITVVSRPALISLICIIVYVVLAQIHSVDIH